ncbi:hypothetical protein QG37_03754 [Candidozyma auris]|nr:hypothetical protein QG37_03754 [[Candida] auris]
MHYLESEILDIRQAEVYYNEVEISEMAQQIEDIVLGEHMSYEAHYTPHSW